MKLNITQSILFQSFFIFIFSSIFFIDYNGLDHGDVTGHVVYVNEILKTRDWIQTYPFFSDVDLTYSIIFHYFISIPFLILQIFPSPLLISRYLHVSSIFFSVLTAIIVFFFSRKISNDEEIAYGSFIFTAYISFHNYMTYTFGGFPYSFSRFLVLTSLFFLFKSYVENRRWLIVAIPLSLLSFFSHKSGALNLIGGIATLMFLSIFIKKPSKKILIFPLIFIFILPWLGDFMDFILLKLIYHNFSILNFFNLISLKNIPLIILPSLLVLPSFYKKKAYDSKIFYFSIPWILYYFFIYLIFPWDLIIGNIFIPSAFLVGYTLKNIFSKEQAIFKQIFIIICFFSLMGSHFYMTRIHNNNEYLTEDDITLLNCIKSKTQENSIFLSDVSHVSQWIPPFTNRKAFYHFSENKEITIKKDFHDYLIKGINTESNEKINEARKNDYTYIFTTTTNTQYNGLKIVCDNLEYKVLDIST